VLREAIEREEAAGEAAERECAREAAEADAGVAREKEECRRRRRECDADAERAVKLREEEERAESARIVWRHRARVAHIEGEIEKARSACAALRETLAAAREERRAALEVERRGARRAVVCEGDVRRIEEVDEAIVRAARRLAEARLVAAEPQMRADEERAIVRGRMKLAAANRAVERVFDANCARLAGAGSAMAAEESPRIARIKLARSVGSCEARKMPFLVTPQLS
jgi:hypothetical protein